METQQINNEELTINTSEQEISVAPKTRDNSIDIIKGILTVFMIFGHVLQFFSGGKLAEYISVFVNLTTFSGFMFCLGYVFPIAYSNRENKEKRMFIGFLKLIFAFYLSSMSFILIVEDGLTRQVFFDILFLKNIPDYSEFLLSFALVFALNVFLFNPIKKLMESPIKLILVLGFCLCLTLINYDAVKSPIIGSIIGTKMHESFPIIQYGFYFLIGFYFSEKKVGFNLKFFIVACLFTLQFFAFRIGYGHFPERFQPTMTWIVGASLFIYLYFLLSKYLENFEPLSFIGKNSIFFLVLSNICIFGAKSLTMEVTMNIWLFRFMVFLISLTACFVFVFVKNFAVNLFKKIITIFKNSIKE